MNKSKTFHILPVISVTKNTNTLSKEAKKSFDCDWNYYYIIKIGWLFWEINI